MKKVNLYCLLISVLCLIFIWGCGQGTKLENSNDSLEVEINLAKSLSVNKQDLKLIGFKTFYVSDENERIKIKELTPIIKEKASNYYIAEDGSFFRVYFPLHTAIVKCNGKIYYSDEKVLSKLMMLLIWMRLTWQLLEENVQNMLEEQVQILLKVINYF